MTRSTVSPLERGAVASAVHFVTPPSSSPIGAEIPMASFPVRIDPAYDHFRTVGSASLSDLGPTKVVGNPSPRSHYTRIENVPKYGQMDASPPLVAIVDDEVSICRALLRLLRVANYRAEGFDSPVLFLESLAERVPDCVVLDLQMPRMTGVELQQHLLKLDDPPPVIIITAHDDPKTRERCLALGAVRYLRKPFEGAVLIDCIEEAVRAKRKARSN